LAKAKRSGKQLKHNSCILGSKIMAKRIQSMIDKFFYWLFGIVDAYSKWIEKQFNKPKKKKRKKK
jgi:hypothetical protein